MPHEITINELAQLLDDGARLLDVREPAEFEAARVPGAVLVPLGEVTQRVDEFRGDGATYVICRSGGRSMKACEFLESQGVNVVNVAGGTQAWLDSGRPFHEGPATS